MTIRTWRSYRDRTRAGSLIATLPDRIFIPLNL